MKLLSQNTLKTWIRIILKPGFPGAHWFEETELEGGKVRKRKALGMNAGHASVSLPIFFLGCKVPGLRRGDKIPSLAKQ